jgi:hypothetical protein
VRARFSAPMQARRKTHPVSDTAGARSFPGVKRPGRGLNHPTPSRAEVKETVELNI